MTYKLFIDDERSPVGDDWLVARSSIDAIEVVKKMGCPVEIAFDHDLGGVDTSMNFIRWLVDGLLDARLHLPAGFSYSVHSQNPIGAGNIRGLMDGLLRHFGCDEDASNEAGWQAKSCGGDRY